MELPNGDLQKQKLTEFDLKSIFACKFGGPGILRLLTCLLILSFSSVSIAARPKYGPAGNPRATSLPSSREYFQSPKHPAPDFWALIGYYVPQFNGYSCSAASVSMVINAAQAGKPKTADDKVISQQELLDKVTTEHWKERLSPKGFHGEYGTSLDQLRSIVESAFKTYGFKKVTVRAVHVENTSSDVKRELVKILRQNEKSNGDFVIANFDQRIFTDDAEVGHIAPVGAFDEEKERVLILDPDREYYEPYWVSLDTFLSGMATKDSQSKLNRGYLVVTLGN